MWLSRPSRVFREVATPRTISSRAQAGAGRRVIEGAVRRKRRRRPIRRKGRMGIL
jgi:hypothetical protein